MILKIKQDIALKYYLNMHLVDSLIDREAIAFEIVKYVDKDTDPSTRTMDNFKFTSKALKYIFGDRIKNPEFKNKMVDSLKDLISIGWLKPKDQTMYITNEMITKFFDIE